MNVTVANYLRGLASRTSLGVGYLTVYANPTTWTTEKSSTYSGLVDTRRGQDYFNQILVKTDSDIPEGVYYVVPLDSE